MAKIGKGSFRWDSHYGDYDIYYSSKSQGFYVDATKLFPGSAEFFDSLVYSEVVSEDQKSLKMEKVHHGREIGMRKIWAKTQKELVDSVNLFNRMFVQAETSEKKVILYRFTYKTETQSSSDRRGLSGMMNNNTQEFEMGFKYRIAIKKSLGDNSMYRDCKYSNIRYSRHDISDMKEIIWTQELEDFIVSFSKSFDGLIDKMKPFFETEGKIMELIGRNILNA